MCAETRKFRHGQGGVTLVELIVFIVVVGVGVAGLVSVTGNTVRDSADPMVRKQMVAIAESLLNEVMQQPFTYCDPDDASFLTATSTAGCTGGAANSQDKGGAALTVPTPAGELRNGGAGLQFDNVADYGGYVQTPVTDAAGGNVMAGYTASVTVARVGATFSVANDAVLQVTVTVQNPAAESFSLSGYRFRYAPRS